MKLRQWLYKGGALALGAGLVGAAPSMAATIVVNANITTSQTWTANNVYRLHGIIYVTNGATLTIQPGVTIRGEPETSPGANDPGTLVIARGSKIKALGTADKPIVFTDLFDDNIGANPGTAPYDTLQNALSLTGQWGGLIVLGRTYVANNTLGAPNAAREVQIEGLTASGSLGLYGNGGNDDDDSGSIRYISIRYNGFNLSPNNEINGLTLGAVGRETDLDHIEIFQPKDDQVEFFGGTANVKYFLGMIGGDDGLDTDEGYRGKIQFAMIMQGTPGSDKSDKGAEMDGGNGPDGSLPMSIPTYYNVTFIGLGQKTYTDKGLNTAVIFRDNSGGRYYNSFFADFGGSAVCIEGGNLPGGSDTASLTSGERSITPYVIDGVFYKGPASTFQLELQDNDYWCFGAGSVVPTGESGTNGCDTGKNQHDNGLFSNAALDNHYYSCATALPIKTLTRTPIGIGSIPDPITAIDPRPAAGSPLLTTPRMPPSDGFFEPAAYKGAFRPDSNWAAGWTTAARLGYFPCNVPEVFGVSFTNKTTIAWSAVLGVAAPVYDILRSSVASNFTGAACVASNIPGTSTSDVLVPPVGTAYYYLVRAEGACGSGTFGINSSGAERTGHSCP
jgi:hypothetical protein